MEVQNKLFAISNSVTLKRLDMDQARRAIQKLKDTYPQDSDLMRDYIQNKSKTLRGFGDVFETLDSSEY